MSPKVRNRENQAAPFPRALSGRRGLLQELTRDGEIVLAMSVSEQPGVSDAVKTAR